MYMPQEAGIVSVCYDLHPQPPIPGQNYFPATSTDLEPTTVVRLQHFLLFGWSRRAGHSEGRRGEDKRTNAWVQARMVLMSCQKLAVSVHFRKV